MAKNLVKSSLKVLNFCLGLGGIAVIVYGVLMIRVWQPEGSSFHGRITIPWFFHAFLGVGIALCATTCLGQVAANTANDCCVSCYIVIILLLLILETVIMAEAFLNPRWQKELPKDLYERLDEFQDFVDSNDEIWKWVAWLIFLIQGVSILLATILRIRNTDEVYTQETEDDSSEESADEDTLQLRLPLSGRSAREQLGNPNIV